jgi:L-erythro-3,5-diaminohexanoate dehydrogenase
VVVADARSPLALPPRSPRAGGPADVTVVCVDVPGCEQGPSGHRRGRHGRLLLHGHLFAAAALGAEGLAADVTMLIGNGYVPGHADYALSLLRRDPEVRGLFESRLAGEQTGAP